jgi:hypothetical protein
MMQGALARAPFEDLAALRAQVLVEGASVR